MTKGITREEAKRCVGEGWHPLVDEFYDFCESLPDVDVHMTQVKEKFGRLCLYHAGGNDATTDKEIEMMKRSMEMCENCGVHIDCFQGDARTWIYSLCVKCYEEHQARRNGITI